jgi:uncharacterized protein YecT (DUF1311 family)
MLVASSTFASQVSSTQGILDNIQAEEDAACAPYQHVSLPKIKPTSVVAPNCDAEKLYYAPGAIPDYSKALSCALLKPNENSLVLAMLYANGKGVPRNIPVALRYICLEKVGAPMEVEGRVQHLEEMLKGSSPQQDFDECNDVTSGLWQGLCAARDDEFAAVKRKERLKGLMAGWSSADLTAFQPLVKIKGDFIDLRSHNEVDLTGTARGVYVVAEEAAQEDAFLDLLSSLENKGVSVVSDNQLAETDKKLNKAYREILADTKDAEFSTINKDGIRETQREWLVYRDAWVRFASQKFPNVTPASIIAALSQRRITELEGMYEPPAD